MKKTWRGRPKVGQKVAFNTLPDAVWFDVLEIDGFLMKIRETNTNYAPQYMDTSAVAQVKD